MTARVSTPRALEISTHLLTQACDSEFSSLATNSVSHNSLPADRNLRRTLAKSARPMFPYLVDSKAKPVSGNRTRTASSDSGRRELPVRNLGRAHVGDSLPEAPQRYPMNAGERLERLKLCGRQRLLRNDDFVERHARNDPVQVGERPQHRVAVESLAVFETVVVHQSQQFHACSGGRVKMLNRGRAARIGAYYQKPPHRMRQEPPDALEDMERPTRGDQEIEQ